MIGQKIGNYQVLSFIGKGGMGSVYLGVHETLGRKVAIKVLLPELAKEQQIRDRFINEAKTLSTLNHHNIVILYDFYDLNDNLFLIMEYVEGTRLDNYINQHSGPIPLTKAVKIFTEILSGFEYAHSKGIIHRDIKPSNIILKENDIPKILDFGIAKIVHGDMRLTKTGMKIGSVLYMSPEQVLGRPVDIRTDIYSLGVTLFEMLCGKIPYNTETTSEYEIQSKIVNEPLPAPSRINNSLPQKIDFIIAKATAKNPNERYKDCKEFASDLSTVIRQDTVIERTKPIQVNLPKQNLPPTYPAYQYGKKSNYGIIVAIASILIVVTAVILWYFLIYNNEEKSDNKNATVNENIKKDNQEKTKSNVPTYKSKEEEEKEVKQVVTSWLNCWQNKDLSCYKSYITKDYIFISEGLNNPVQNYDERLNTLSKHFRERQFIYITYRDMDISITGDKATVTYFQEYVSDKFSDKGYKKLLLRKENGKWLIYSDTFRKA